MQHINGLVMLLEAFVAHCLEHTYQQNFNMSKHIKEWYLKHNDSIADGVSMEVHDADTSYVFTCTRKKEIYRFAIHAEQEGKPAHQSETEVDREVNKWIKHIVNQFDTRYGGAQFNNKLDNPKK